MQNEGIAGAKVSDISDTVLSLPRPGVTRTVKEMEQKGYLKKIASPGRWKSHLHLTLTETGQQLSSKI